jgi:hypothetical protein
MGKHVLTLIVAPRRGPQSSSVSFSIIAESASVPPV